MSAKNWNALPDDPGWCGHGFVSLRTWTCADCERPATDATRARLEGAATVAPPGKVWVLLSGNQDYCEDGFIRGTVDGIYADRATIPRRMIRGFVCSAVDIREAMRRTHWYQGVFNADIFDGWQEEPDERGTVEAYRLSLKEIE